MYMGIDPGKTGAVSVIDQSGKVVESLLFSKSTERDTWNFFETFTISGRHSKVSYAALEKVSSSPQMGVTSAFSFGRSYGLVRGILIASEIPFIDVTPQTWMRKMKCLSKGDKNVTKAAAQQLFPKTKITHGNADSLLLAEYMRRVENHDG